MSNASGLTLNDKYLRLLGIPLAVFALMLSQMPVYFPGRWDLFAKYTALSIFFTGLMWEIARVILIRVRRRLPGLAQTWQRVGWSFLLFVIQFALGQVIITWVFMALDLAIDKTYSFFQIWLLYFSTSLFFIAVISSIYEATYFFSQYKAAFQKTEELKKQHVRQQLNTLKNRVNPHFLFNSLTTLSALIPENPPRAEQFVDELAKVYRYLLRAGRQVNASLGEELQFAEAYSFLLKNRFETGAFSLEQLDNTAPEPAMSPDRMIPVLTFQHVLDYLIRTQNIPLYIHVSVQENYLCFSCENHPKMLSFESADHDWYHLESKGARQEVIADHLTILIPFTFQ